MSLRVPCSTRVWSLALLAASACSHDDATPSAAARNTASAPNTHNGGSAAAANANPSSSSGASKAAARRGPWPLHFLARRELRVGGKPALLWAGDLDGDGRTDLAAALQVPGRLLVWRGTEHGLARDPLAIDAGAWPVGLCSRTTDARAGAPARVELVLAAREPACVQTFALRADGALERVATLALSAPPTALAVPPRTSPCASELAALVALRDERAVLVSGAELDSARATPHDAPHEGAAPNAQHELALTTAHACCAWITQGGDLAVGSQATRELVVWASTSSWWSARAALAPTARTTLSGIPRVVRECDLDGDGDLELVAGGGDRALWVLGAGARDDGAAWRGATLAPREWKASGLVPLALECADLDADGRAELVAIAAGDSAWGVQSGFGPQGAALTLSEYAGQTPVALALGAFDGDARVDLAVANRDAQAISLSSGTGLAKTGKQAFYQAARIAVGRNPVALAAAPFSGDAASEVVALNAGSADVRVLDNAFGLLSARAPLPAGPSPRALRCGDFDGDGASDAAWLVDDGRIATLRIARADPRGGLASSAPLELEVGTSATALAVGRVGGGGNGLASPALLALDRDGNRARLVAWDASRRTYAIANEIGLATPREAVFIDWDADARDEVVIAADRDLADSPPWRIDPRARADASGLQLASLRGALPPGYRAQSLASADFDGDGKLDLALLASNGVANATGRLALLANRGADSEVADVHETGLLPARVWAGDLDGDGLADAAVAAQNNHLVQVWLARKTESGVKLERQSDLGAGLGPLDVLGVDLNVDGVLDLVVANNFSDDVSALYDVPPK